MSRGTITRPDYLQANDDSDWNYYVPDTGHGFDAAVTPLGYASEFDHATVWLRPVKASSLDDSEREDGEVLERDAKGRFAAVIWWIECSAVHPDATAWFGVRYAG